MMWELMNKNTDIMNEIKSYEKNRDVVAETIREGKGKNMELEKALKEANIKIE